MLDTPNPDHVADAIRVARAEFGVDLAPDDPIILGYVLYARANEAAVKRLAAMLEEQRDIGHEAQGAVQAMQEIAAKTAKAAADEAALSAVDGVLSDQRNTTDKVVTVLEGVIKKFEAAGLQFQRLVDHRDGIVVAANDLQNEMRAFSTEMVELRDMVHKTRSHALFLPIAVAVGAATFVLGVATGLAVQSLI